MFSITRRMLRQLILGFVYASGVVGIAACGGGSNNIDESDGSNNATYTISGIVSGDVQEGVVITLSGAATSSATTDDSGFYSFSNLESGSYSLSANLEGYVFDPEDQLISRP